MSNDSDQMIGQLMSMGYEHQDVIKALKAANNDSTLATQYLIEGIADGSKKNSHKKNANAHHSKPIKKDTNKCPKSEKISHLMSMGFECDDVLEALSKCDDNQQRAADYLLKMNTKSDGAMQYLLNKEKSHIKKERKKKQKKSAYYLYSSTDKTEALKYRPKKVDIIEQKEPINKNKKGSTWNTGATMEQIDYSAWMQDRLKYLLLNQVKFTDSLRIHEVNKVEGSATYLVVRNKLRPGYDITFECQWKGTVMIEEEKREVEGKLYMTDVTSEDDREDWEYDVTVSANKKEYRIARNIVRSDVNKQRVLNVLDVLIQEFHAKKQ